MLLIFLGELDGLPLLKLPLEEKDKGEDDTISDYGGVACS
jgi:hypothetical protein